MRTVAEILLDIARVQREMEILTKATFAMVSGHPVLRLA